MDCRWYAPSAGGRQLSLFTLGPFNMRLFICIFAAAILLSCSVENVEPDPDVVIAAVAESYQQFRSMTNGPVYADPYLAYTCKAVDAKMIEESRKAYGPHTQAEIVIYMNELAAQAFDAEAETYPVGAVVVKEKAFYASPTGTSPGGIGGMVKRTTGFDPSNGDWEYFYRDDVTPLTTGAIQSCVDCHQQAADRDYVFGDWAIKSPL